MEMCCRQCGYLRVKNVAMAGILACQQTNFHEHDALPDGGELWEPCGHVEYDATLQHETQDLRALEGGHAGISANPDTLMVMPIWSGEEHHDVHMADQVLSEEGALAQIMGFKKCTEEEAREALANARDDLDHIGDLSDYVFKALNNMLEMEEMVETEASLAVEDVTDKGVSSRLRTRKKVGPAFKSEGGGDGMSPPRKKRSKK